jgi:hypothetical protein
MAKAIARYQHVDSPHVWEFEFEAHSELNALDKAQKFIKPFKDAMKPMVMLDGNMHPPIVKWAKAELL